MVQYTRSLLRPGRTGHAEIAQLVEHATENRGVASSILALGTTKSGQPGSAITSGSGSAGRASPCQGEGRGFEPRLPLHSSHAHPADEVRCPRLDFRMTLSRSLHVA